MKVCLLSPYPPAQGGIAVYARRIADGLRQHGLDLVVIPLNRWRELGAVLPQLRRLRPQVVRVEYAISMYGPGLLLLNPVLWLLPRWVGCRLAVNYHEPVREMARLGWFGRQYYRWISHLFARIYVHTQEAREALVVQAQVPAEKIRIIPFGTYDFPDSTDRSAELEATYQLGQRTVVLFFGYIHIVKGIDHFLQAAHQVFAAQPELRGQVLFVVAGSVRRRRGLMRLFERQDHAYNRRLRALQIELGLSDDVRFLDYIDDRLVYSLLVRAQVVVVPYTTAEQSSLLTMAIPLGKPTVASDLGGHRELLAEIGGLVQVGRIDLYAEEIRRLLNDPAHYAQVVAAYRALAERDSTPQVTRRLAEDLRALAGSART